MALTNAVYVYTMPGIRYGNIYISEIDYSNNLSNIDWLTINRNPACCCLIIITYSTPFLYVKNVKLIFILYIDAILPYSAAGYQIYVHYFLFSLRADIWNVIGSIFIMIFIINQEYGQEQLF